MTKRKASVALETGTESNQSSSTQDNNSNSTSATNTTTGTNNAHGMQNGSSSGANGSERPQQISNSNNAGSHKTKKERADNWSSAEIQVLHRGIESRRDIFYGPPSQATKRNRELAWEAITKDINSVSTTPRSLGQVMKKFKNEKCRAKRKFTDSDKDSHNDSIISNSSVNSNSGATNNNNGLGTQNHTNNNSQLQSQQQTQQQQPHHMSTNDTMSTQPSSINVVKLAPQNVAKTMIDLPGHVQQIQMPNDDMVLIVPEMDGILSGMNIVSDGSGHHFQKCTNNGALNGQQHGHQAQHTIQAINTGSGLVNGNMGNGMMARAIPAGSMCSLVYSTGNEVCGTDQHISNNGITGSNQLSASHISVNAQNLMHHRGSVDQGQVQQQASQQQLHHPLHHQQQQQHSQQPHQQSQPQHLHQPHQSAPHHQHQLQQNHLANTAAISNTGGVAVESQLKNLLFNLLLKDGQHAVPVVNHGNNQDYNKQRNDMLAIIAGSLDKIEGHLSKISRVASSLYGQSINNNNDPNDNNNVGNLSSMSVSNSSMSMNNNNNNNDGNNNNVNMTSTDTGSGVINSHGTQES